MKGKLIVIEGLDGCGKQTQANLLCDELKRRGYPVHHISFPDYGQPSSALVKMYLNSEFGANPEDVNGYAASAFYSVDRYASYIKFWKEYYRDGYIIIADRYTTSNVVYQMPKLEKKDWENYLLWIEDFEYNKFELPVPDAVIYLDLTPEISQKLMSIRYEGNESKKDIHENNIKFQNECREAALYAAKNHCWDVINCSNGLEIRKIEDVHNDIMNLVLKII